MKQGHDLLGGFGRESRVLLLLPWAENRVDSVASQERHDWAVEHASGVVWAVGNGVLRASQRLVVCSKRVVGARVVVHKGLKAMHG